MATTQSPVIPFNSHPSTDDTSADIHELQLPKQGMSRAKELLPFLPFGRTTLHEWSKDGRFPAPVKLSPTMVAWHNSDVIEWLENQRGNANAAEGV